MVEPIFFNPWIWILGAVILVSLIVLTVSLVYGIKRWGDMSNWWLVVWFSGATLLFTGVGYFGFLLPPYDTNYYQTYRISGEVANVESAFSGDEGTMSQVFIAEVEGVDKFIRSDDQRFRTVAVGDDVNLVCSLQFRYFQEPWYECAFGGV